LTDGIQSIKPVPDSRGNRQTKHCPTTHLRHPSAGRTPTIQRIKAVSRDPRPAPVFTQVQRTQSLRRHLDRITKHGESVDTSVVLDDRSLLGNNLTVPAFTPWPDMTTDMRAQLQSHPPRRVRQSPRLAAGYARGLVRSELLSEGLPWRLVTGRLFWGRHSSELRYASLSWVLTLWLCRDRMPIAMRSCYGLFEVGPPPKHRRCCSPSARYCNQGCVTVPQL
jgi:hypothetical protein